MKYNQLKMLERTECIETKQLWHLQHKGKCPHKSYIINKINAETDQTKSLHLNALSFKVEELRSL